MIRKTEAYPVNFTVLTNNHNYTMKLLNKAWEFAALRDHISYTEQFLR